MDMGQVDGQIERDMAVYRAWVDGETQEAIAARRGVTRQAISQAIHRALDQLPDQDKAAEIRRTLDQVEELSAVYRPLALAGNMAANREWRGLQALKGRFLGVDRREVHVEGQIDHVYVPGPTVDELLEKWREQGKIRGEITRTDQP
jgi:hypothetical protein